MNNSKFVLGIALITALTSCKKDEVETPATAQECGTTGATSTSTVINHFPMTVGSYWIYETVSIDTLGSETPYGQNDTVTVIGDTLINGNTYTVLEGTWLSQQPRQWHYRDSANYIVTAYGALLFTDQPTNDTIGTSYMQNIGWLYKVMSTPPASISTPAGTFSSLFDTRTDFWADDPNYPWGHPRSDHSYFAEGVGNVLQIVYFMSSPSYLHRRLTEYHIAS